RRVGIAHTCLNPRGRWWAMPTLQRWAAAPTLHCLAMSLAFVIGCNASPPPAAAPATRPSVAPSPALTILDPAWNTWTREECVEKLPDETFALAAALRLIDLAHLHPTCVPATLADVTLTRLRVAPLEKIGFAAGIMDLHDDSQIHAPLIIATDGGV